MTIVETLLTTLEYFLISYFVLSLCFMIVSFVRNPNLGYTFKMKEGVDQFFTRSLIFPFLAYKFIIVLSFYTFCILTWTIVLGLAKIISLIVGLIVYLIQPKKWRHYNNGKEQNIIV